MKNKKLFVAIVILSIIFEWLRVYFIMPMPGSQKINSIDLAYFLHSYRWVFRIAFIAMMLFSISTAWNELRKTTIALLLFLGLSAYLTNFPMSADTMFKMMNQQNFANKTGNLIDTNRLIIGVVIGNEAKAYPINVIAHHHQVKDKIAGQEILVTYCSVCRTGKVYNPTIKGKSTDFRLVGMDHFNAMFEDPETKSWWRQVNGTCIAGELKGEQLKEITCYQTTLKTWLALYPQSLILQQDPEFKNEYKDLEAFDDGSAKSSLIGRNKKANEFKSWVVWANNHHQIDKADWTSIEKDHYVYFHEGQRNTLIVSNDNQSVFAFDVTDEQFNSKSIQNLNLKIIPNETMFTVYLETNNKLEPYLFTYKGEMINQMPLNQPKITLKPIPCSQEFKHSFDQFQGKNQ